MIASIKFIQNSEFGIQNSEFGIQNSELWIVTEMKKWAIWAIVAYTALTITNKWDRK